MKYSAYPKYKPSRGRWLSEVPEHWDVVHLRRRLLAMKDGTHGSFERVSDGIPLLSAKNVSAGEIVITENESMISREDCAAIIQNGFPRKGDVLLTIVGTVGRSAVFNFERPLPFQRSVAFLRLDKNTNPEFMRFVFESALFQSQLSSFVNAAAQGGAYMGDVAGITVPVAPRGEQPAIADFLDRRTAELDALIAKKRALIEKLKEKRSALLSQTVTRGLPPEAARAAGLDPNSKMKASGIEWLGDVPEHWTIKKLGHVSTVVRGASPRPAGDTRYFDGDFIPWITVGDVTKDNELYLQTTESMLTQDGADLSRVMRAGTLVITNSGATLGVPKILSITGCANDGIVAFENLRRDANNRFLCYFLSSITENLRDRIKQGSGQPNLNTEIIRGITSPYPPEPEQRAIADFLDRETAKIDSLVAKVEQAIERLQEYRTALITAAVTGKIDVTASGLNGLGGQDGLGDTVGGRPAGIGTYA